MATNLETKIQRIQTNVTAALAAIADKGVTVPAGSSSDDLEGLIGSITGGEDLTAELDEQESKLNLLLESLNGKAINKTEVWVFTLEDGSTVEKYVGVSA